MPIWLEQKGDFKKKKKTYSGKKEPSRWLCCFRNAIYPQTMLAHLRFPLCRKQLTEYKKQSGVKGCLVACFKAEGRVKPFKVHFFVNENIFCKATAHRIWNMMPFVNSPSGMMRRKKKNLPLDLELRLQELFCFSPRTLEHLSQHHSAEGCLILAEVGITRYFANFSHLLKNLSQCYHHWWWFPNLIMMQLNVPWTRFNLLTPCEARLGLMTQQ